MRAALWPIHRTCPLTHVKGFSLPAPIYCSNIEITVLRRLLKGRAPGDPASPAQSFIAMRLEHHEGRSPRLACHTLYPQPHAGWHEQATPDPSLRKCGNAAKATCEKGEQRTLPAHSGRLQPARAWGKRRIAASYDQGVKSLAAHAPRMVRPARESVPRRRGSAGRLRTSAARCARRERAAASIPGARRDCKRSVRFSLSPAG